MGEQNGQPAGGRPPAADPAAGSGRALPQPVLRCPFCGGRRFDYGRDIFAGPDQLMYCRQSPLPGQWPDEVINLPMKGAVCLDCGYVAMMVDINQLHAPIRRFRDPASALAARAGAAAHLARDRREEAARALERMKPPAGGPGAKGPTPAAAAPPAERGDAEAPPAGAPQKVLGAGEDDFPDLGRLIEEAERQLGLNRPPPEGRT